MEEREKGDDEKNRIVLEVKNFFYLPCKEGVILKESHKRWERVVYLSMEQTRWIIDSCLDRNLNFGESRRKESKLFGRSTLSLIEGSYQFGCFLSIHVEL